MRRSTTLRLARQSSPARCSPEAERFVHSRRAELAVRTLLKNKWRRPRLISGFDRWVKETHVNELSKQQADEAAEAELLKQEVVPTAPLAKPSKRRGKVTPVTRDLGEIRRWFDHFDADGSGVIEPKEWAPLLSKLLKQPIKNMDMDEVWRAWHMVDTDGSDSVTFDEFQIWYCDMFGMPRVPDMREFFNLEAPPKSERLIRDVARKFDRDHMEIEKMWKEFNFYDQDESGFIDYDEFEKLMNVQLAPFREKKSAQMPSKVLQRFWHDIDTDGNGRICFEEFACWYLTFFHGDASPMEKYYQALGTGYRKSLRVGMDLPPLR